MFSLGAGQAWARYKGPYVLCWHGCPPRPILPVTDTAPSNSTPRAVWPPRVLHGEEPLECLGRQPETLILHLRVLRTSASAHVLLSH